LVHSQNRASAGAGRRVDVVGLTAAVEGPPVELPATPARRAADLGGAAGDGAAAAGVAAGAVGVGATGRLGRVVAERDRAAVDAGREDAGVVLHVDAVAVRRQRRGDRGAVVRRSQVGAVGVRLVQRRRRGGRLVGGQDLVAAGAGRGVDVVGRIAAVEGPPVEDSGTGEVDGAAGGGAAGDGAAAAGVAAGAVGVGATGRLGRVVAERDRAAVDAGREDAGVVLHVDAVAVR